MSHLSDPHQLLERIIAIFPEFSDYWREDNACDPGAAHTPHSVYMSLLPFVHSTTMPRKPLARFAELINEAVAAGGESENAAGTCFLEHLGPSPLRNSLWPFLTAAAKRSARP